MSRVLPAESASSWLIFACIGATLAVANLILPAGIAGDATLGLMVVAAIGAVVFGYRTWRPENRGLQLLAASLVAFCLASIIFAVHGSILGEPAPYPSVADAVYLVSNLLLVATLVCLGWHHLRETGPLIEAAIIATAFAAFAWVLIIAPNLHISSAPLETRFFSAAYPVTDILIVAAAALLVVSPSRHSVAFVLIATGAVSTAAADIGYAWSLLHGSFSSGNPIAMGWVIAFWCFGTAALHPSMRGLVDDASDLAPTLPFWRMGLLIGAVIATPLLLLATQERSTFNLVSIAVATVLLYVLTLLRVSDLSRSIRQAMTEVRAAEAKYRALIEQVPASIYTHGSGSHAATFFVNSHTEAMLGYTAAEWSDDPDLWATLLHPDDRERLFALGRIDDVSGADQRQDEYRLRARDGRYVWLRDDSVLIRDESGNPAYWQGVALDVTAERAAQEAIREGERRFRILFSSNPHPMWVYDAETLHFLEVNDAAVAKYGYSRDEFLAMTILAIRPPEDVAALLENLRAQRSPLEVTTGWRHQTKDGGLLDVEITSHTLTFDDRDAVLVVAQDVTQRKVLERQLEHQALHDALTGLPNRALVVDRLDRALAAAGRRGTQVAVLFLDLDRFKVINDGLGHEVGDRLLIEVARRLRACIRAEDTLARFGGDEFVVLIEEVADVSIAEAAAARLVDAVKPQIVLDGQEVSIGVSIGLALGRAGAHSGDLLREADVAMYHAKRERLGHAVFRPELGEWARERIGMEAELRRAIVEGGLTLHYQPIVDLVSERILAVEALVRWQHPTRGLIAPGEFIPVAEESGLIVPLGRWVLQSACRQLAAWRAAGVAGMDLGVSVNLSARQVGTAGIVADVATAISSAGLRPADLELEITETVAMAEDERTIATLRALGDLGVRLAVDDFGAGASPLGYLRRCPVDALKIDRSYVTGLTAPDGEGERMIRAVLAFAATLGMAVTAEGIETPEQASRLHDIGCERGQGYLFARPQPPETVAALLAADPDVRFDSGPILAATA